MKPKHIPPFGVALELTHPGFKALIAMPYRDDDDLEPRVRAWAIPDGEEIPVDPTLYMLERILEDYQTEHPDEDWTLEELEETVRVGTPIIFMLR